MEKERAETAQALVVGERTARSRQRYFAIGLALLLAASLGAAGYALQEQGLAEVQRQVAEEQRQVAEDKTLEANAAAAGGATTGTNRRTPPTGVALAR